MNIHIWKIISNTILVTNAWAFKYLIRYIYDREPIYKIKEEKNHKHAQNPFWYLLNPQVLIFLY